MKRIITALLIILPLAAPAQTKPAKEWQYCTVQVTRKFLGNKLVLHFDYGSDSTSLALASGQPTGKEPALRNFTSITDVLNYLAKRGWELVTVVFHELDSPSDSYEYYFKKQVQ